LVGSMSFLIRFELGQFENEFWISK
jgi:hypothetical protein